MIPRRRSPFAALLLRQAPLLLLLCVFAYFGVRSPAFRTLDNVRNILVQSSSVGIVAAGLTLVLLTGGIDLSVGAIMFLTAAVAGKLVLGQLIPGAGEVPVWSAFPVILVLGSLFGLLNATAIAWLGLAPFIVTLATLYVGRGLALQITGTRALNLPADFVALAHTKLLGVPLPVVVAALVFVGVHVLLSSTVFGRQLYALGGNPDAARRAGIPVRRLLTTVYVLSGLCAAIGGCVSVAQLAAVAPSVGYQREFAAIAAAVLGGTSLFGGRGSVLPGTLLGAVLIQTVESGLVMVRADPYVHPMVTGAVIFLAVFLERFRGERTRF